MCPVMDKYDIILLSAVRKGDVHSMQTCLSSMSNPNVYLNRVYDEPKEQKCTLLMIACLKGHEKIVNMLLDNFKPDLEGLNIILINNKDKKLELYRDVTVLWATAALNHFLIVKRLVEHGACVNHRTNTNSTPLRCACCSGNIEMVRYLVEHSADIHITEKNHETNLSLSVYCEHSQVSAYLVDELCCDVNECDDEGHSALYFAVKCGSLEMVRFLFSRGARNFYPGDDRMSPLMLAADKRHCHLVDEISLHCSLLERIEAEELLGNAFACAEHGFCDLEKSFEHYQRALELRSTHNLPKFVNETDSNAFNNRQECQTIDELEALRLKPEDMHIEALIVRERLLGAYNEEYRYSVVYRGAVLANSGQYNQAIALWMYDLTLSRHYGIPIIPEDLRQFVALFSNMVHNSFPVPIDALLKMVATTVREIIHSREKIDYNLYTLLFLTTLISQPSVNERMSLTHRETFYRFLHCINQGPYTTRYFGSSLLHLCLNGLTAASHPFIDNICRYPCWRTVRTLLQYGADVNKPDKRGNTPLHIFAANRRACDEVILQLLCDAGAHLDHINASGKTPIGVAIYFHTKLLLKSKMKISLKCICARLIRRNNLPFHGKINKSLVNFVQKH